MAPKDQERRKGNLGKVVVIGGNGNLGAIIVNQLVDNWTTDGVVSIDLRCQRNVNPKAAYHECDITDGPKLTKLFTSIKPDVVIHTASPLANDPRITHAIFKKVNVDGTQCVVDACQNTGVKALVYTSSASVVSNFVEDIFNADERWPVLRGVNQSEYYSETKAAAEEIVLNANRTPSHPKFVTCSLRPAAIFGEGEGGQIIKGMMKVLRDGKQKFQVGDNTNVFDFTYSGNVAHAHCLAARLLLVTANSSTAPLDYEKVDGEAFFITNDSPCYFWDFFRAVHKAAGYEDGKKGVWEFSKGLGVMIGTINELVYWPLGKQPTFTSVSVKASCQTRYYNIAKAKARLGYEPLWTLQEGVEKSVKWFLEFEKQQAGKTE